MKNLQTTGVQQEAGNDVIRDHEIPKPQWPNRQLRATSARTSARLASNRVELTVQQQNAVDSHHYDGHDELLNKVRERFFAKAKQIRAKSIRLIVTFLDNGRYETHLRRVVDFVAQAKKDFRLLVTITAEAYNNRDKKDGGPLPSKGYFYWTKNNPLPDDQLVEYVDFCRYVKLRLQDHLGAIDSFSIWNEPNLPYFMVSGPNAKEHQSLLALGRTAAADELFATRILKDNARLYATILRLLVADRVFEPKDLLVGELSSKHALEFIGHLRATTKGDKWKKALRGFAIHPYQHLSAPDQHPSREYNGGIGNLGEVHRRAKIAGFHANIYLTEFGYFTSHYRHGKNDATRLKWLKAALTLAYLRPYVKQLNLYQLLEGSIPPSMEPLKSKPWDTSLLMKSGRERHHKIFKRLGQYLDAHQNHFKRRSI